MRQKHESVKVEVSIVLENINVLSAQNYHPYMRPSPDGKLELIHKYPLHNHSLSHIIQYKWKALSIHKYFTPYTCLVCTALASYPKCKVNNIEDTTHLVLVIPYLLFP